MRRFAILAGAAAIGAAAFFLIRHDESSVPELSTGSRPMAAPGNLADRTTAANQERQASGVRAPRLPLPPVRNDFELGLGSEQSDLLAILQKGTRPDAAPGEEFLAYQIVSLCYFAIRRMEYAQLPGASGETVREADAARARLAHRCSTIERIGIDQILRDFTALRDTVNANGSLWPPDFTRARNDTERDVAVKKMAELFSEFGPVALQWISGNVLDYLRVGTTPFARQVRGMTGDDDVLDYAVYLAMCSGSDICGEGGLLYLENCSQSGRCGGNLLTGLFGQVTPERSRLAQPIAQKILAAIRTGEWTAP